MSFIFVIALLVLAREVVLKHWHTTTALRRHALPGPMAWCGAALLPAGFGAQLAVVDYASRHDQLGIDAWLRLLPMRLAFHGPGLGTAAHTQVVAGILVSVALQTAGLIAVGFARPERHNRLAPIVAGCALALLAIPSSVLTSGDVYFYAYASTLGLENVSGVAGAPLVALLFSAS